MKHITFYLSAFVLIAGCSSDDHDTGPDNDPGDTVTSNAPTPSVVILPEHEVHPDSVEFSFVFVGCNRVGYSQQFKPGTNASSANLHQLQRTWQEVSAMNPKPKYFFFLGDLVEAEANLDSLYNQLPAWIAEYDDPNFSPIKTSGIEMVAVPGNHEMLYYDTHNDWEYPLTGATEVWNEYMDKYMPSAPLNRITTDSVANSQTYSFDHGSVHFIVMNTDTYNEDSLIGQIPNGWIQQDIINARQNPNTRHIFLLGHKPSYVGNSYGDTRENIDSTLTNQLWPVMKSNQVEAMLSAHNHQYCRSQPTDASYQIIAGNGGSPYTPTISEERQFFGYSVIHVMKNGQVHLQSLGRSIPMNNILEPIPDSVKTTVRDAADISWGTHATPYDCQ